MPSIKLTVSPDLVGSLGELMHSFVIQDSLAALYNFNTSRKKTIRKNSISAVQTHAQLKVFSNSGTKQKKFNEIECKNS